MFTGVIKRIMQYKVLAARGLRVYTSGKPQVHMHNYLNLAMYNVLLHTLVSVAMEIMFSKTLGICMTS